MSKSLESPHNSNLSRALSIIFLTEFSEFMQNNIYGRINEI